MTNPIVPCPFRLCSASVETVIEQAQPDDDESMVSRIPMHDVDNPARMGAGVCPASLLTLPLEEYSRRHLDDTAQQIERMIAEQEAARPAAGETGGQSVRPRPESSRWFRHNRGNGEPGYQGYPPLRPVPVPDDDDDDPTVRLRPPNGEPDAGDGVGPTGRIALEFLPGADEGTGFPPPESGPTQGANVTDSMRQQYRDLTRLAIEGFGQAQDMAAGLTARAEELDAMIAALKEKQGTAHSLAIAAVGGGDNIPQAAANMVGSSAAANSTIDDIAAALQLMLLRIASVHQSLGAAVENGREYLAQI